MTIIKCDKCGSDAEVDSMGMVVCSNPKCRYSHYDSLMDIGLKKDFQPISQSLLSNYSVDWNSYKNWCVKNSKKASDAKVLLFYVTQVVGTY